jgi:hypothetical protein
MTRRAAQLNIRSDAARRRVAELVAKTGRPAAQIVEDAVQAYAPPPKEELPPAPDGYDYKGWLLIKQKQLPVSSDELLEAIERDRNRPMFVDNAYLNDW